MNDSLVFSKLQNLVGTGNRFRLNTVRPSIQIVCAIGWSLITVEFMHVTSAIGMSVDHVLYLT